MGRWTDHDSRLLTQDRSARPSTSTAGCFLKKRTTMTTNGVTGAQVTTTVGIRAAKANLSRLLRHVQEGGEVIVTDHGRAVAKIVPILAGRESLEELVRDLELRGVIEKRAGGVKPPPLPVQAPAGIAQRLLQEDRDG